MSICAARWSLFELILTRAEFLFELNFRKALSLIWSCKSTVTCFCCLWIPSLLSFLQSFNGPSPALEKQWKESHLAGKVDLRTSCPHGCGCMQYFELVIMFSTSLTSDLQSCMTCCTTMRVQWHWFDYKIRSYLGVITKFIWFCFVRVLHFARLWLSCLRFGMTAHVVLAFVLNAVFSYNNECEFAQEAKIELELWLYKALVISCSQYSKQCRKCLSYGNLRWVDGSWYRWPTFMHPFMDVMFGAKTRPP